jgi:signal transduction histidine kinase/CheY-like chemotaxis protein/HPt (histidine-containing phosphotransfer) domain-containing protein
LQQVNNLFKEIVVLDHMQHAQTFIAPDANCAELLEESHKVQLMLDTLKQLSDSDELSLARIDSMKTLLLQRDTLLLDFLDLNYHLVKIDTLNAQLKSLTRMVGKLSDSSRVRTENSLVTTIEDVTDTLVTPAETVAEKKTIWNKLFKRKKAQEATEVQQQPKRLVQKQLKVTVDTISLAHTDKTFYSLSAALQGAETSRMNKRNTLLKQQIKLANAGNELIAQAMSILHEVEKQELESIRENKENATEIVNTSVVIISVLLFIFIVGAGILLYIILTDVAKSNAYRAQLQEAKDEAEQLGMVKQRFLANMSHELRTPLQTIVGVSEQLQNSGDGNKEKLGVVHQSSLYLLQIVNEILDYSRIVSGKFKFEARPFDLVATIDEVSAVMQVQAQHKGLRLVCMTDIASEQSSYMGDAFRLKQILYNLLGNAVKFTEQGRVALEVTHTDFSQYSIFVFSVKDTGIGIAAHELSSIFEQFEQSSGSEHAHKGTGLGLNIVKLLVEGQHGSIQVKSEPGVGTQFDVTLTYQKAPAGAVALEDKSAASISDFKGKVWVVDDDPFILDLCCELLNKHHIPNQCFHSSEEVLQQPVDPEVRVILSDIRMPRVNGMELCRRLKGKVPAYTKIFALTAQAMPDEKDRMREAGFDGVLMKPFLEQDFINVIATGVAEPQAEQLPGPGTAPYDLTLLREMLGEEDEGPLRQILGNFRKETLNDLHQLRDHLVKKDAGKTADSIHRIGGRLAQMGAAPLAARCKAMEFTIREEGQLPRKKIEQLAQETGRLMELLRKEQRL